MKTATSSPVLSVFLLASSIAFKMALGSVGDKSINGQYSITEPGFFASLLSRHDFALYSDYSGILVLVQTS